MMSVYETLKSRKSIRSYKSSDIPDDILTRILNAATLGPTSGNMQVYSIIITKDKENKNKLYKIHSEQKMILEASVCLTFCSDFHRTKLWLKARKAKDNFNDLLSFLVGTIDATVAAQSAALAAESEGLGTCFVGSTLRNMKEVANFFKLPKNVLPVTSLVIGYPNENPEKRDRLPIEGIIHNEKYMDYNDTQIETIFKQRDKTGWDRYMDISWLREKIISSKVENLAQVYTELKYTKDAHIQSSKDIIQCLKDKDFINEYIK